MNYHSGEFSKIDFQDNAQYITVRNFLFGQTTYKKDDGSLFSLPHNYLQPRLVSSDTESMPEQILERWRIWIDWMTGGSIPGEILVVLKPEDVKIENGEMKIKMEIKFSLTTRKFMGILKGGNLP